MHGETITLLLLIALGFTTWQGLNRPGVMERYLFSTEAVRMRREWLRLVSPAFLHGSWGHFAGNAITLYFFGRGIENMFGPGVFLGTFFLSVAGGHVLCLILHPGGDYRAVGASGGALGLLFSMILLSPGMTILLFPLPIPIPAWLYAVGFLFYSLFSLRDGGAVSHEAHLGGMMTGVGVTLLQHPRAISQQPILVMLILGAGSFGIWYFHSNPGRVPGFLSLKWRERREHHRQFRDRDHETRVDALLDKVSQKGLHSLSARERAILRDASRKRRNGR